MFLTYGHKKQLKSFVNTNYTIKLHQTTVLDTIILHSHLLVSEKVIQRTLKGLAEFNTLLTVFRLRLGDKNGSIPLLALSVFENLGNLAKIIGI